ncbi:hypothetical protein LRAMOSA03584 [Lichtheimia ramosa]|uniref:ASX DEUBAD domain-containing protein n=1 Tax=Lichtheimia ramosa TaxID=688394 RepID=A0A077WUK4_9FUNG|nr:hypothetical protein LRAMOSA03584 [Lichtheimia ramosa]
MTFFDRPSTANDDTVTTTMLSRSKNDTPEQQQHYQHDLSLETSQLMIRSPPEDNPEHQQPYKKFRQDPWSWDRLCSDANSPLATLPLDSVFDYSTFQLLPPNDQAELARMLPSVDNNANTIQPSFFSRQENPIFWNALDDWQTMLGNGELSDSSSSSNSNNTIPTSMPSTESADPANNSFKDEAFEAYWGEINDREKLHNVAGDSKNITLKDMCRRGLIREQDVIVYKRNFSACKVVVSKSMRVVKANGSTGISIELDNEIFEDFETPTALETKILDRHGKITKDKRPNGNAFKSIRLIRDGKDLGRLFDIRKDGFGETN